jgi:hypothetical protein
MSSRDWKGLWQCCNAMDLDQSGEGIKGAGVVAHKWTLRSRSFSWCVSGMLPSSTVKNVSFSFLKEETSNWCGSVTYCLIHRGNDSRSRSGCKGWLWYELSRYIVECSPTRQTRIYSRPRIFKERREEQWFISEYSGTPCTYTETSGGLFYLAFLFLTTTSTPARFTQKCIYPYFLLKGKVGWSDFRAISEPICLEGVVCGLNPWSHSNFPCCTESRGFLPWCQELLLVPVMSLVNPVHTLLSLLKKHLNHLAVGLVVIIDLITICNFGVEYKACMLCSLLQSPSFLLP